VIVDADTCYKVASDHGYKEDEQDGDDATGRNSAEGEALSAKDCELNERGGNRQTKSAPKMITPITLLKPNEN
jgi:hypothetical protein